MTNEAVFRRPRGGLCAAAFLITAAGCSGLTANQRSPAKITADNQLQPTLPPVPAYGPDAKLTCPDRGPNGELADLLKKEDLKGKQLVPDGRLCAMAETLLGWQQPSGEPLPENVRAFLAQYFGLSYSPPSSSFIMQDLDLTDPKPGDVAGPMVAPLTSFAENAKNPHYGLIADRVSSTSSGRGNSGGTLQVKYRVRLVMFDELVVFDPPVPRSLPAGGNATLSGKIQGEFKSVKVQVVDPAGKLTTTPAQGQAVNVPLACGERQGKMLVQISADSDSGDVRLANFPVACGGGQLPTQVAIPNVKAGPVDPGQAEKQIAEAVNSERSGANLKPLNVSAPLSDIARTLADKQAAGKGVSGTELQQMLKEKDISAPSITENAARAFSADEAYSKLSESPSDRATQMNPDSTDIGVGVVKGADVAGKPTLIVTVLYLKQAPPIDPKDAKAKMYDAITKKRTEAKLEPLETDEVLESVAQKYADAAVKNPAGTIPREEENGIMAPLYKNAMVVNQLGGWVPDVDNALAQADQGSIVGKAKMVGVGMATGRSDRFGKNSLFVMVLVGSKSQAAKPTKARPGRKATKRK
jgi:uncharacterized protein YkwD